MKVWFLDYIFLKNRGYHFLGVTSTSFDSQILNHAVVLKHEKGLAFTCIVLWFFVWVAFFEYMSCSPVFRRRKQSDMHDHERMLLHKRRGGLETSLFDNSLHMVHAFWLLVLLFHFRLCIWNACGSSWQGFILSMEISLPSFRKQWKGVERQWLLSFSFFANFVRQREALFD